MATHGRRGADGDSVDLLAVVASHAAVVVDEAHRALHGHVVTAVLGEHCAHPVDLPLDTIDRRPSATPTAADHLAPNP